MSQLNWTEAQWNRVNSAITEEFTKASVAGACLPCYGPVGASMEAVSKQGFDYNDDNDKNEPRIKILDNQTTPFWTIRSYVHLNSQQVADENLSSALFAFKRAANLLARTEDYLVFQGHNVQEASGRFRLPGRRIPDKSAGGVVPPNLRKFIADSNFSAPGLITDESTKKNHLLVPRDPTAPVKSRTGAQDADPRKLYGESLVRVIAKAITTLEKNGYPGPFACVLGQDLFIDAHTPKETSLVLPADRITPMLAGPLLRSGSMPDNHGVVASSCGEALDLVVATPPKAQFLQVNEHAKYVFRVYERFVLRIKDAGAVIPISLE